MGDDCCALGRATGGRDHRTGCPHDPATAANALQMALAASESRARAAEERATAVERERDEANTGYRRVVASLLTAGDQLVAAEERLRVAEAERDHLDAMVEEVSDELDALKTAVEVHLPRYVADNEDGADFNHEETVEQAGSELAAHARLAARGEAIEQAAQALVEAEDAWNAHDVSVDSRKTTVDAINTLRALLAPPGPQGGGER